MTFLPSLLPLFFNLAVICFFILLFKYKKLSKTLSVVLVIIFITLANVYYFAVRIPQQQRAARLNAAQLHFATLPLYRTIKRQQPTLYPNLLNDYLAAVDRGESESQALAQLRPALVGLISQRISYASSEALNRYIEVLLEEINVLREENTTLCFKFLFPQVSGGIDMNATVPAALRVKEAAAMNYFMQHSLGAEQTGDVEQNRADLQNIVRELYKKWGSDLQLMNAPAEMGADKTKLCEMTIELYQYVLALPVNNSAGVLRIILDGNAS